MFFAVIIELGPFSFMLVLFVIVFAMFQIILSSKVADEGSEYPGMHPYLRMVIQTFRISTGELKTSDYSKWADDP